jgi:hypothetical protein
VWLWGAAPLGFGGDGQIGVGAGIAAELSRTSQVLDELLASIPGAGSDAVFRATDSVALATGSATVLGFVTGIPRTLLILPDLPDTIIHTPWRFAAAADRTAAGARAGRGYATAQGVGEMMGEVGFAAGTIVAVSGGPKPKAYTVGYEFRLDSTDLGRSRPVHFRLANAGLDAVLTADPEFAAAMELGIPGASKAVALRENPSGWTWHHAPLSAAVRYPHGTPTPGLLQLVPRAEHTSGAFRFLFHPGGFGGYAEWAIPAGAPPN